MGTDSRDKADPRDSKLRHAIDMNAHGYSDRWPARGPTNTRSRDYRPLDDVSREKRQEEYKGYPHRR